MGHSHPRGSGDSSPDPLKSTKNLIFPLDAIPDLTPVAGYADDLGAIVAATAALGASINRKHIAAARKKTTEWFGKKN